MKITVEIERLILEGVPVGTRDAARIKAAVEGELTRMLASGALGREVRVSGAVARVAGEKMTLKKEAPGRIGERIARSIYGGITGGRPDAVRDGRGGRR
jgi:hypothetical protein